MFYLINNCTLYNVKSFIFSLIMITEEIPSIVDVLETVNSFIMDLSCPSSSSSIELMFTERAGAGLRKRQEAAVFTITMETAPNMSLVSVDKDQLSSNLVKGRQYSVEVERDFYYSDYFTSSSFGIDANQMLA